MLIVNIEDCCRSEIICICSLEEQTVSDIWNMFLVLLLFLLLFVVISKISGDNENLYLHNIVDENYLKHRVPQSQVLFYVCQIATVSASLLQTNWRNVQIGLSVGSWLWPKAASSIWVPWLLCKLRRLTGCYCWSSFRWTNWLTGWLSDGMTNLVWNGYSLRGLSFFEFMIIDYKTEQSLSFFCLFRIFKNTSVTVRWHIKDKFVKPQATESAATRDQKKTLFKKNCNLKT